MMSVDWFEKLGLKHLFLFLLLVGYSLFGALIFVQLEKPADLRKLNATYTKQLAFADKKLNERSTLNERVRELVIEQAAVLRQDGGNRYNPNLELHINEIFDYYDSTLYKTAQPDPNFESKWDIWSGLFYSGTLYTTIGYGNIFAETAWGKVFTVFYSMMGIPIAISILNDWGGVLFNVSVNGWHSFCLLMMHLSLCMPAKLGAWWRKMWLPPGGTGGDGEKQQADASDVPVLLAIFLLLFWIALCSGVYMIFETEWTFGTAVYFFFISLTTIGLGDITPKNYKFTCCSFVLVLIGLSVVSMAINVMQAKVDAGFERLMEGIDKEYKTRMCDEDEGGGGAAMGILQLRKKQSVGQRILYKMMGEQKKKLLAEKFERMSRLKNTASQTEVGKKDFGAQVNSHSATIVEINPPDVPEAFTAKRQERIGDTGTTYVYDID